jgi:hypothetical protein
MKAILLFAVATMVIGPCGGAWAGSATQEAMDEEVATNRALTKVPEGKKVTGTSCNRLRSAWEAKPLIAVQRLGSEPIAKCAAKVFFVSALRFCCDPIAVPPFLLRRGSKGWDQAHRNSPAR